MDVLKCRKILVDNKSKRNPLEMLKAHFLVTLQVLNMQLCQKRNSTSSNFQLICLPFKNNCFKKKNFKNKEKSNNFEMQCIVCYSRCIALVLLMYFQLLQLVRLTDRWSTFYETRMNRLMGHHLSAINKKETEY